MIDYPPLPISHEGSNSRYVEVENRLHRIMSPSRRLFDGLPIRKKSVAVVYLNDDMARFAGYRLQQRVWIDFENRFYVADRKTDHILSLGHTAESKKSH